MSQTWSKTDSDLQVDGEALHGEARLEAEGVKLLRHRQHTLQNAPKLQVQLAEALIMKVQ